MKDLNSKKAVTAPAGALQIKQERRRWWIRLLVQPALFLLAGAILIAGLGVAQRMGFITAGGGGHSHGSTLSQLVKYICPMMCTPPQTEPGRCPVCAMELVPATSDSSKSDSRAVQIDPAARRIANIQTAQVSSRPLTQTINAVGELNYDEGNLKTLSAYIEGRIEHLYADFTGVEVKQGDKLAYVYSPQLYSAQVELLTARETVRGSKATTLAAVREANRKLYSSARQRLIESGMTEAQINTLESTGTANSRMYLYAPISGTVIEKQAIEGQYVKEGQVIYQLADLSSLWLMLELFPEDAARIRYGQKVEATVQSQPDRTFSGRVAFIDPQVDPQTRTVSVRIVMPNPDQSLRVGDYARAAISLPAGGKGNSGGIYDPELADCWICPRHPHVISHNSGTCSLSGLPLVPTSQYGYVSHTLAETDALAVPRDAVLMAGQHSVVYVETEPGRFEIRNVVLGPTCGDQIVILKGVAQGEQVAIRGNFLIDSQMQLAGNPSLIDPTRAEPLPDRKQSETILAALSQLPEQDRKLAEKQQICPVTMMSLGSMGAPAKVDVNGETVFICCEGCRESLLERPRKYLDIIRTAEATGASRDSGFESDLPPLEMPQMILPDDSLPPLEMPMELEPEPPEQKPVTGAAPRTASGTKQEARQ
ncbi:efflux RND transporter periplasmic adaptor subunit [Gimesia chilikensis]|uniref:efflux RND transporter periplasmic adaptor subunit n=1 Tax=Gimesia chilikensis TaxID=2605989 RepID=UPI0011EBF346|nr:efflux RND transporter periplasmic adaptor subunit [Gimesia chilikensis]KAA0142419.1 efflux RND transporter periplasmic adaptor subunit [Gimesia chilikensis]